MNSDPDKSAGLSESEQDGSEQARSSLVEDELSVQRRGFVTTTGVVCQIAGIVFVLGACGFGSLSGWFQKQSSHPVETLGDYLAAENLGFATATVATLGSFVLGLGLVAAGVGLQGERAGSEKLAMVCGGLLGLIWLGAAVVMGIELGSWVRAFGCMIVSGACLVVFMLAGNSARLMKLSPPPQDQGEVSDDFLESLKKGRHY
jgi:hypothetical protein